MGILDEYVDQSGTEHRVTSDETRVDLLGAMGFSATSEASCTACLERLDAEAPPIPPVVVEPVGTTTSLDPTFSGGKAWKLTVRTEDGEERRLEGSRALADLGVLPVGYHTLELHVGEGVVLQRRIVTPPRCPSVLEITGRERAFGIAAQLYAVRSRRNWGVGDLADLDVLVTRAASWGAAFVGLNPLHALENRGANISPYSPVSRLFRNWLYIDVASVPEHDGETPDELGALRSSARVDYDRVAILKLTALRRAYDRFLTNASTERRAAFASFVARGGKALQDFAVYSAMTPEERARGPRSSAGAKDEAAFHAWLQFELDRQLAAAAAHAKENGLAIGLYQDLAIGCAPDGSDVWANPELFVTDASIGAPPDGYSKSGQNWGLPPMSPHRLRASGYRYWSTLLRNAFAHGGALRMDHVIGLFRQFWVPRGKDGTSGAFVRYPADDLLGILALEATRAKALVVGEDLGTVPEEVPGVLERYGVLSSRVLYFEVTDGAFHDAADYAAHALTTANTHDMAPLAGWLEARDVDLKEGAGIIDGKAAADARERRGDEKKALARRVGVDAAVEVPRFVGAVHGFLARTPSVLVGVSLDDVVGEVEPVNVPGTTSAQSPNWTRRYCVEVEALPEESATLPRALRER